MKNRWAPAFSVIELVLIIIVLAILVVVSIVGYRGVRENALSRAAQSDLDNAAAEMQRVYIKAGEYPSELPSDFKSSDGITTTVIKAGESPYYTNVTPVQNGVLLAQICQDLIDEGVGKATNQGGVLTAYITGCGNWNHDSMQVTGWSTKKWSTPVTSAQLTDYANTFTTNDTYNKVQETVVKNFYTQLVERLVDQGGSFPVNSFWDYWATPTNGGVIAQPLSTSPRTFSYYCIEARPTGSTTTVWHVEEDGKIASGAC